VRAVPEVRWIAARGRPHGSHTVRVTGSPVAASATDGHTWRRARPESLPLPEARGARGSRERDTGGRPARRTGALCASRAPESLRMHSPRFRRAVPAVFEGRQFAARGRPRDAHAARVTGGSSGFKRNDRRALARRVRGNCSSLGRAIAVAAAPCRRRTRDACVSRLRRAEARFL